MRTVSFGRRSGSSPQNAELKKKRKNPNVLMTGDILHIPDLTIRQEPGATEATHKFVLKGVPEVFHMKVLDANHQPRANLPYTLVIEGVSRTGATDATGGIKESIPPNAKTGKLTYAASPSLGRDRQTDPWQAQKQGPQSAIGQPRSYL